MGARVSTQLRDDEISDLQEETGCKWYIIQGHSHGSAMGKWGGLGVETCIGVISGEGGLDPRFLEWGSGEEPPTL